jgi:hypothetical protein
LVKIIVTLSFLLDILEEYLETGLHHLLFFSDSLASTFISL